MSFFFRARKFLAYQYHAKTKYYIHSPFVYQFYLNVLEAGDTPSLTEVYKWRKQLALDNTQIRLNDLGAKKNKLTTPSQIEKQVAVKHKYGKLLFHLIIDCRVNSVMELGTCVGISTAYMAKAIPNGKVVTVEGDEKLHALAIKNIEKLNLYNVTCVQGNFDDVLQPSMKQWGTPDLVFFDGNHRKEATIRYFEECVKHAQGHTIFVFDDIYYNQEMYEAWQLIKAHGLVTLTIDVFQFGICFFQKDKLAKEDFVLRY